MIVILLSVIRPAKGRFAAPMQRGNHFSGSLNQRLSYSVQ
jgi:hypothetical protein